MLQHDISSVKSVIESKGYVEIPALWPNDPSKEVFSRIGKIIDLPGIDSIQTLVPRRVTDSTPNTYSGNFGLKKFPLHTDLAHWSTPPRYFALRCLVGVENVATRLLDSRSLIAALGKEKLTRTLVRPRRPVQGFRPLLRLLESKAKPLIRWDQLFISPATADSSKVVESVHTYLENVVATDVFLTNLGDTLIIDNWRMLHGRSPVLHGHDRKIERAYFGELN